MTATFWGVAPGSLVGRVKREGVEMKITKPRSTEQMVTVGAWGMRMTMKKSTDWAMPEKRKRDICRLSFFARIMPMMVPGMPVRAIIREMNWPSTTRVGFRGTR